MPIKMEVSLSGTSKTGAKLMYFIRSKSKGWLITEPAF
jgi:hypothetical protein